jgi:hypothetical protein
VIHSEPVHFEAEARVFVLHGEVAAAALYEGTASLDRLSGCIAALAKRISLPPLSSSISVGWMGAGL